MEANPSHHGPSVDWESQSNRTSVARVPFATVLASAFGLWLTYFLLTTLRWELLGLGMSQDLLWPRALVSLSGVLITLGLWLVLRLFDARPLMAKIAAALVLSLPVAVASAQVNQLIMEDLGQELVKRFDRGVTGNGGGSVLNELPGLGTSPPTADEDMQPVVASRWQDMTDL